jgi:hypothetical protein
MELKISDNYIKALRKVNTLVNVYQITSEEDLIKINSLPWDDLKFIGKRFLGLFDEDSFNSVTKVMGKIIVEFWEKFGKCSFHEILQSLESTFLFGIIIHQLALKPDHGIRTFFDTFEDYFSLWIANCTFADSVYRNYIRNFEPDSYNMFKLYFNKILVPILKRNSIGFFKRSSVMVDYCIVFYSGYLLSAINDHATGLVPFSPELHSALISFQEKVYS